MEWPRTPIEYLPRFRPPFCPRRDCSEHLRREPGYRFQRNGYYSSKRRKRIQRFLCATCGKGFSRQTFSVTYYRKRPELLAKVAAGLVACSALRQIARSAECAPNTAARISAHLGRHAMLFHARTLAGLRGRVTEPFVFDHFETFEFTQDFPFGVGTAVGAHSWFLYGIDPAPHGRGGRRTPAQARRLQGRPKRLTFGRYAGSTRRVLDALLPLCDPGKTLYIRCDAHQEYVRAAVGHPESRRIALERHRNVPKRERAGGSREAAARDRAMRPMDALHSLMRHSLSHERRETLAFTRRLNASMERLSVTMVWRNFIKRLSEKRRRSPTPAMSLGLTAEHWTWKRVFSRRLFHDRIDLPEPWPRLYRRGWITPVLGANARHDRRRAF